MSEGNAELAMAMIVVGVYCGVVGFFLGKNYQQRKDHRQRELQLLHFRVAQLETQADMSETAGMTDFIAEDVSE